jgi:glucosyl-dolichyl phosphate glucuronosyltransferase
MSFDTISVVICTHNRVDDTRDCLNAVYPQLKDRGVPLLLVDSGSTSPHREAIVDLVRQFPGLLLIRLDEAGLSLARTAAIKASETKWVAFLDDDSVPAAHWFERLSKVVAMAPDNCAALGGQLLPLFPGSTPRALRQRQKMYLSINDTIGDRDCTDKFELIAANCCFRRSALLEIGCFPAGMGRIGTKLLSGEDVMVMRLLRAAGWRVRYNSEFSAGHKIVPQRLTDAWLRERAYWEGITTLRMAGLLSDGTYYSIFGKAVVATPATGLMALTGETEQEWSLRFAFNSGVLAEAFWHAPRDWLADKFTKPPVDELKPAGSIRGIGKQS